MFRRQVLIVLTSVLVLCTFLGGPLLHNVIPHSHGADHHGVPSAMWGDMHSSLRHEDKQLLATVETILATFLALLALLVLVAERVAPSAALSVLRARDESLRTGRERYRRFG